MAEEDEYDPNANVPLWINIVVPIAICVVFVLVLVGLHFTDKEVSADTIERWLQKLGITKENTVPEAASGNNSTDQSQKQIKRPYSQWESSANSVHGKTTSRSNSRAGPSRQSISNESGHIKTYGSIASECLDSSCYKGYTNTAYCYESNV